MAAKRVVECRTCLRRLTADAQGWQVLPVPGGTPEYLCPGCRIEPEPPTP